MSFYSTPTIPIQNCINNIQNKKEIKYAAVIVIMILYELFENENVIIKGKKSFSQRFPVIYTV